MSEIGCSTCTVTIQGDGTQTHETGCISEDLKKHKQVLGKILHALKEAGIAAVEIPIEIAMSGKGGM